MASSQQLVHATARDRRPRRPVRKPLHDNEYLPEGLDQLEGANPQVPQPTFPQLRPAARRSSGGDIMARLRCSSAVDVGGPSEAPGDARRVWLAEVSCQSVGAD